MASNISGCVETETLLMLTGSHHVQRKSDNISETVQHRDVVVTTDH